MRYHLSDDQVQVRDVITAFLADRYDQHARDAILRAPGNWSPEIWANLGQDLGVLALSIPESAGGMGGGAADILPVMEAMGEALVVEPFLETCVLAPAILGRSSSPSAQPLLAAIAGGTARFAFAFEEEGARFAPLQAETKARRTADGFVIDGRKAMVICAPAATHLLVTVTIAGEQGIAVLVVPADHPAVTLKAGRTLDGKGVAQIDFSSCVVDRDALILSTADGAGGVEAALDSAIAALCAEATGIMRRLIRDTLGYLEQRRQFNTALIDFQVIQHRLADMQVQYEQVQAMAFFAAGLLSEESERRAAGISAAKVFVATALRAVAQEAVQLHGAMGVTEELMIGHLFKRATALENEFGSIDYHLGRVVEMGLPDETLA